jgi:hypothetical protein
MNLPPGNIYEITDSDLKFLLEFNSKQNEKISAESFANKIEQFEEGKIQENPLFSYYN